MTTPRYEQVYDPVKNVDVLIEMPSASNRTDEQKLKIAIAALNRIADDNPRKKSIARRALREIVEGHDAAQTDD